MALAASRSCLSSAARATAKSTTSMEEGVVRWAAGSIAGVDEGTMSRMLRVTDPDVIVDGCGGSNGSGSMFVMMLIDQDQVFVIIFRKEDIFLNFDLVPKMETNREIWRETFQS